MPPHGFWKGLGATSSAQLSAPLTSDPEPLRGLASVGRLLHTQKGKFMKRRSFLGLGAAAAAALLASSASGQPSPTAQSGSKTYVLVHGAYGGGWIWRDVAEGLRQQGHRVLTPTQTGLGERNHLMSRQITVDTHIEDVVNVIETEELTNIILGDVPVFVELCWAARPR